MCRDIPRDTQKFTTNILSVIRYLVESSKVTVVIYKVTLLIYKVTIVTSLPLSMTARNATALDAATSHGLMTLDLATCFKPRHMALNLATWL